MTVELSGDPGADEAHLELRHLAHVPDDLWDQFGPGAVGIGWDLGLMGLDLHLSSGDALDRGGGARLGGVARRVATSSSRSSTAWAEASIAGGTDATRSPGRRPSASPGFYTADGAR